MKVSEAKEKVCPFIQQIYVGTGHQMYGEQGTANINCICGDCMAWKWTERTVSGLDDDTNLLPEEDQAGYCKRLAE